MLLTGKNISCLFIPPLLEERCLAEDEQILARGTPLVSNALRRGCFHGDTTLYLTLSGGQPQTLLLRNSFDEGDILMAAFGMLKAPPKLEVWNGNM